MTEQKLVVLFVARLSCLKAQLILINVFLVQYLSGNLSQSETRCSKCLLCTFIHFHMRHNLSHTCGDQGSTVLLTMTIDVPLSEAPDPRKLPAFKMRMVNPGALPRLYRPLRLLHLAWFWRVDSSYRAAPTQPLAKSCIGLDG